MDWQAYLFDPSQNWLFRFEQRARSRFVDENLALQAVDYALGKLQEDDWRRLSSYSGKRGAKPATYLFSVFNNLIEDYARSVFGYPRPKKWIKQLGDIWVQVWKRLCLERTPIEALVINLSEPPPPEADFIRDIIQTIKAKEPHCGGGQGPVGQAFDSDEMGQCDHPHAYLDDAGNPQASDSQLSMDTQITAQDTVDLFHALTLALNLSGQYDEQTLAASGVVGKTASDMQAELGLDSDETLLIRLVYQEGFKLTQAAEMVQLPYAKARSSLKGAERKIHDQLTKWGIDFDSLFHD